MQNKLQVSQVQRPKRRHARVRGRSQRSCHGQPIHSPWCMQTVGADCVEEEASRRKQTAKVGAAGLLAGTRADAASIE